MVSLPADQVTYRKRIGVYKSHPVYAIGGIGGVHCVAASTGGRGMEMLGVGSHPLLARIVAERHGGVEFDDLEKSARSYSFDPRVVQSWTDFTSRCAAYARSR